MGTKTLGDLDEATGAVNLHPAVFSASCHRVPTLYGHIEALFIELENDVEIVRGLGPRKDDAREHPPRRLGLHMSPDPHAVLLEYAEGNAAIAVCVLHVSLPAPQAALSRLRRCDRGPRA